MRRSLHQDATALTIAATLAAAALACVDNPPLPADLYDPSVRILAIDPSPDGGPVAEQPVFTASLNTYLDPAPLTFFNAAALNSGGVRASVRADYRMVDKQLVVTTRRPLEPGLIYDLTFNPDAIASVTGQPFQGPALIQFLSGDAPLPPAPAEPEAPRWAEIEPLLAPCNVCHLDPEWQLPAVTREAMVGVASEQQPELVVVRPFDAPASYLMHKILWDYPLRHGTAQPPPWAGYDQLSIDAQRLIERWINAGALP